MTMRQAIRNHALEIIAFVALASFVAFTAGPKWLAARQRSRQNQTAVDMRRLAHALEARATDENMYALGAEPVPRRVSLDELERALSPKYIKRLPRQDAWGNDFDVFLASDTYIIRSRGSDGEAEGSSYATGYTTRFEHDLVFSEGSFVRAPYVSSTV